MRQKEKYDWSGDTLPAIDEHSKTKHEILRLYLEKYLSVVTRHPKLNECKLLLVDGFAGGGVYDDGGSIHHGSPLIFLKTTMIQAKEINERRETSIDFDFQYVFVDHNKKYLQYLKSEIKKEKLLDENRIMFLHCDFHDAVEKIINKARHFMPRVQKCIIFIDPYDYTSVHIADCQNLMRDLVKAEIVLIFHLDVILNYLNEKTSAKTLESVFGELPESLKEKVNNIKQLKEKDRDWKQLIQKDLYQLLLDRMGHDKFISKYFITSQKTWRSYWFLHICRHPKARDVMQEGYWILEEDFEHCGGHLVPVKKNDHPREYPLLNNFFVEDLRRNCVNDMREKLPKILDSHGNPIKKDEVWSRIANYTPLVRKDFHRVITDLKKEKEIVVKDGSIYLPMQRKFFF